MFSEDRYPGGSFPSPYSFRNIPPPEQPAPPSAKPPVKPSNNKRAKRPPLNLTADHIEQLAGKNLVKARGHVVLKYLGRTVKAHRMIVNTETGKGKAFGNVIMLGEDGTIVHSKKAFLNIKSKKGKMYLAKGQLGTQKGDLYFVKGKQIDKIGAKHFIVTEASLTTCTGKLPAWSLHAKSADLITKDRAWFKGGVIRVKSVPIIYMPLGYVPLDNRRKSGFLIPTAGVSNLDGFTFGNQFFWAINDQYDATFSLDYLAKRGFRGGVEFRYTPSRRTAGQFNATYLDDDVTGNTFWKIDAFHKQRLPYGFNLNAKLDLSSDDNFNKTFANQTENRTRRSSDSWATLDKSWYNSSLNILTRYRKSEEDNRDDTFGLLPQAVFQTQSTQLGNSPFYFNQETSFTNFLTDIDISPDKDDFFDVKRLDFHPQLSLPMSLASWLNFTPQIGLRGTYYKQSARGKDEALDSFTREMIDINAILEGPKFNKVFDVRGPDSLTKYKHIIEPRVQYDFIPSIDKADRKKIYVFDAIDALPDTNRVTYFLTQRLFRKTNANTDSSNTMEIARFEISQSYDFNEESRKLTFPADPPDENRPFSIIRFDWDSRPTNFLMLNFDTTYNIYDNTFETFNFDIGIKPFNSLMLILERRLIHDQAATMLGTLDYSFYPGWNFKFSVRYDEFIDEILEKNFRLSYGESCACWGFNVDVVQRNNINGELRQEETRILFNINLKGIGEIKGNRNEEFIHRRF